MLQALGKPLRGVPFSEVILELCGRRVLPVMPDRPADQALVALLRRAAERTRGRINAEGIRTARPNEAGNAIEPLVKKALEEEGCEARTPLAQSGKAKASGYPDIEFADPTGAWHYLECKTYHPDNVKTAQRSFYLSPSDDFKVTRDARHFAISFEILAETGEGGRVFRCRGWKVLSLENLLVDVKFEFNSDNRRLYGWNSVLAEGPADPAPLAQPRQEA